MKNKILILLIIALSLLCLFSCGGDDDGKKNQIAINCHNGEEVTINNVTSSTDNYIAPVQKTGHTFIGYYTQDGVQYFDGNGNQNSGLIIESNLDLYARFEPYTFTIELNSQTGFFEDNTTKKTITVKYGEGMEGKLLYVNSSTPKYEFDGWFNEYGNERYSNGTEATLSLDGYQNNSTIKMYAQFKVRELTVTLNYNDGLSLPDTIKVKYGEAIGDLSAYTLDNGTEEITGWSSSSYYESPLPQGVTEDITIYAVWTKYKKVDFVYPNNQIINVKVYEKQGQSSALPKEELPGYKFHGWYANEILSGNPISNVPYGALSNIYYGKWEEISYKLTFASSEYEDIIYHYGDTTMLPAPSKEGHTFGGWVTNTGESFYSIPSTLYGDYTLTAKWTPIVYSVGLEGQGGTTKKSYATIEYGSSFSVEVPLRKGYEFLGWYDDAELGKQITDKNGNCLGMWLTTTQEKLYAKWEIIDYQITFNGELSESIEPIIYNYGDTVTLPIPEKENYVFQGWKLDNNSTLYFEIDKEMLGDKNFYAMWLHIDEAAIVTFETDGGTQIPNQVYKKGEKLKLPANVTKEGLFLDGWYNETMDTEYKNGMVLTENITIYAKWIESTPISSVADLEKIRQNPSKNYHLTQDINLKFDTWTMIESFSGILDGNGYKISNIVLNGKAQRLAMFNDNRGTIKNLFIENVSFNQTSIYAASYGAILAVLNDGSGNIINCHLLSGTMSFDKTVNEADPNAGGWSTISIGTIVGVNAGLISGCTSYVDISGTVRINSNMASNVVGGLVGVSYGTIEDCYTELSIKLKAANTKSYNQFAVGGMLGVNHSGDLYCTRSGANCELSLDSSQASGGVFASYGGFVGRYKVGTITECYAKGTIYAVSKSNGDGRFVPRVGGFVGYMEGTTTKITNCYSETNVTASGMAAEAGAFAGNVSGEITNCAAYGAVSNSSGRTGTWAGYISSNGSVKGCFTTLTGAFHDGCDGVIVNNANANDHSLDELKSADFIYNTLYFDREIWIADGKNLPILAWQAETEE